MRKTLIGIIVTTFTLYFWGFIYWGINTLPYSAWQQTPDDQAAQEMLIEHFPTSGTYFVPGRNNDAEIREALYSNGPTGFVHIKHGGSSEMDPAVMLAGFAHHLVIACLLVGLFRVSGARELREFIRLAAAAGLVAVVAIDVGDMIWWQVPVEWKLWQMLYNYSVWLLAGVLLGIFLKQDPVDQSAQ